MPLTNTYEAGRSTETALHHLVGIIENAKEGKEDTLGIFMDIEGAFDNTSFDMMEKAAASLGIEALATKWIAAMPRIRVVHSTLGGSAVRAVVGRGCPLLWLLVVDGLLTGLEELGVRTVASADDVALMVTSRHASMLHSKMQPEDKLRQDGDGALYKQKKGCRQSPSIYNTELNFSGGVKYIGLWLDKKISWKKHIAMQTNTVTITYWACRRMFGSTWGLRSKIAAVVGWTALNKACHRKAVDRVGRLAMLGITGALRTTPSSALEALLFMQPPHLIIRDEATKSATRLRLQGTWKEARAGRARVISEARELQGLLSRGKYAHWAPPQGLVWYTDGSGVSERAGAKVWSQGPAIAIAIRLESHATVLQTELAAQRTCARMILERGDKGKKIVIYSDSRRALRAILKYECCSKLVGNEKDDELANNGCRRDPQGKVEHLGVQKDFVKELVKERGERRIVDRAKLRAIAGLITGHWTLTLYLSRIGKGTDPRCKRCGLTEEDPRHLCTRCSGLDEVRWDVFGSACTDIHVNRNGMKGLYEFTRRAHVLEATCDEADFFALSPPFKNTPLSG
ncbi:uncharacterized protein LOC135171212 [Diachasmimorpha longicaudata]|uniref:uncharacterized protein LOC135171212 n=1 Tax=Diachasmimorpha longicaudata TaxID=58733 RepID=UPI0030B90CBB